MVSWGLRGNPSSVLGNTVPCMYGNNGAARVASIVRLAGLVGSGLVWSGLVRSGQVRSGQVRSGQVRSGRLWHGMAFITISKARLKSGPDGKQEFCAGGVFLFSILFRRMPSNQRLQIVSPDKLIDITQTWLDYVLPRNNLCPRWNIHCLDCERRWSLMTSSIRTFDHGLRFSPKGSPKLPT